ncbi:hypothetical protein WDZ92_43500, partial [Nostoc sp. NIES-2111]
GSALFQVSLWPTGVDWSNYVAVFREQPFARNILNSIVVAVAGGRISLAKGGRPGGPSGGLVVTVAVPRGRI